MERLSLAILFILGSTSVFAGPLGFYLPPNIPSIIRGQSTLFSHFGRIVDGAGYSMHNTAFSLDLAMQANPPVGSEMLGTVTLEPFQNGRDQKWGTSFYGSGETQVELSNGLVGKNFVSVYYPEGSSRDKARLYDFISLGPPNLYKIMNRETKQCLVANQNQSQSSGSIQVEFGSCVVGNHAWLLRRTG